MSVLLRDQPVASTRVDRHGEEITEDALRQAFESMPAQRPIYENHDATRPPVGRAFNSRLQPLSDGALAIVCDIELYDERRAQDWKGMSIAFHKQAPGSAEPRDEFAISFNSRYFSRTDMEAVRSEFGHERVELWERGEKSLVEVGLIIYIVCSGFFQEAGADAYRLWKATLLQALRHNESAKVAIQSPRVERSPEVLLVPSSNLEPTDLVPIDFNGLIDQARELAPGNEVVKVVIAATHRGIAYLDYAVDARGVTLTPP